MPLSLAELLQTDTAHQQRRARLVQLIGSRDQAQELHHQADREWEIAAEERDSSEFLWRGLVRMHTTVQGVRTWRRFIEREAQLPWDYDSIFALTAIERKQRFSQLVAENAAADNWRVTGLVNSFALLPTRYDLERRQEFLRALQGAEPKIDFFDPPVGRKPFPGFGPKYARNFWLDLGDPDVSQEHFAIDSRLQKIIALVWPYLASLEGRLLIRAALSVRELYQALEVPLREIAVEAQTSPWRADRIMFAIFDSPNERDFLQFIADGP